MWPQSFFAAEISQEQYIIAARIRLTELSYVPDNSIPFHISNN